MSTTPGQIGTCAQCGAPFMTDGSQTLCPQCAAKVAPQRQTRWQYYARGKVSLALVGICVAVYLAMVARGVSATEPQTSQLLRWGANFAPESLGEQPWRLVTSMFVHAGIYHILFNMWALLELGPLAEMIFRRWRFFGIYMLSGIAGSIASSWWHPLTVGVGASGAIFGVAGALLIAFWLGRLPLEAKALRSITTNLFVVVIGNLIFGAAVPAIDNAAHVGGLTIGIVITLVLVWRRRDVRAPAAATWLIFPIIAVGLTGAAFAARRANAYVFATEEAAEKVDGGQMDAAIAELQPIVKQHPEFAYAQEILGEAYLNKRDYAPAVAPLEAAHRAHPDEEGVLVKLAVAYLGTGRTDDAIGLLRTAMRLAPDDATAAYDLGLAYETKRDRSEALEMYKRALQLDPQNKDYQQAVKRAEAAELP
jgi:membrane associated rhomboid family serine protease/predicted negative regulator of RcsB-dependent stress response